MIKFLTEAPFLGVALNRGGGVCLRPSAYWRKWDMLFYNFDHVSSKSSLHRNAFENTIKGN